MNSMKFITYGMSVLKKPNTKFKCRKLFKVEILNNNTSFSNEELASIMGNLRSSLTSSVSLNLDILTEHAYSALNKHY